MRLGRLWRGCATGDPEDGFEHCVRKLTALIEGAIAELKGEFWHPSEGKLKTTAGQSH